ncbi:MAG: HD domain-containing phosphohydrolase [Actinomycetota bacterium]
MRAFLKLPVGLRFYVAAVSLSAAPLLTLAFRTLPAPDARWWAMSTLLIVLTGLLGRVRLKLGATDQWLSFDVVLISFAQLTCGLSVAMLSAGVGAVVSYLQTGARDPLTQRVKVQASYRLFFNFGVGVLSAGLAGAASDWATAQLSSLGGQAVVPAALVWAAVYFLANTLTVVTAIAMHQKKPVLPHWKAEALWIWPGYGAAAALAALMTALWTSFGLFALLPLPLIYFVHTAHREHLARAKLGEDHIKELNRVIESLMTSLAMAIEAKDVYTKQHIQRVQYYSVCLAEAANLDPEHREAVRLGALVHDVGKIAIPDRILSKPGKLTTDEFQRMRDHVTVGSMILDPVGFRCPVAESVRSHHERWDGLGYPDQLRGDQIPVGGRVIAIADVFDALTSSRPYRRAMQPEEALAQLERLAGEQLDPELVKVFVRIYPEISRRMPVSGAVPDADKAPAGLPDAVYKQIAAAAADDITAAFDVMETLLGTPDDDLFHRALERLRGIIPSVSAVIYEFTPNRAELIATTAVGEYDETLKGMTIRVGEGVSGRAAVAKTPFLNAPAMADVGRVFDPSEHLELSAALCAPVVLREETIAVITLYHSTYEIYQPHHQNVLTTIAGYLATALDLRRRSSRDRQVMLTDPGTGLYNIRYLVDMLSKRALEPRPEDRPLALLMIDLDQLRTINERFGREIGDEFILEAARKLRECAREPAQICRYGGDEFVIVLDDTNREDAERLAVRVRQAIKSIVLPDDTRMSCGVGVAAFPGDVVGLKSLIAYADLQMYQDKARAKSTGRGPLPLRETPSDDLQLPRFPPSLES